LTLPQTRYRLVSLSKIKQTLAKDPNMAKPQKKYKFTKETVDHYGAILHRIVALRAFGDVKKGEPGGFIEAERNLDHSGNAWVYGDAWVSGNAWVYGDAWVYGNAWVSGNAWVYGDARVYGNARVSGNARVYGDARVYKGNTTTEVSGSSAAENKPKAEAAEKEPATNCAVQEELNRLRQENKELKEKLEKLTEAFETIKSCLAGS
jgi:hypothetical protein